LNEKLKILLFVGSGGFIGSVLRYLISVNTPYKFLSSVPSGTLLVNIIGCFIIGIIFGMGERTLIHPPVRFFLTAGFCGGFTTFSAFSVETYSMLKSEMISQAIIYIIASIIFGLAATFLGFYCIRLFQ
jgi:CrcB protein